MGQRIAKQNKAKHGDYLACSLDLWHIDYGFSSSHFWGEEKRLTSCGDFFFITGHMLTLWTILHPPTSQQCRLNSGDSTFGDNSVITKKSSWFKPGCVPCTFLFFCCVPPLVEMEPIKHSNSLKIVWCWTLLWKRSTMHQFSPFETSQWLIHMEDVLIVLWCCNLLKWWGKNCDPCALSWCRWPIIVKKSLH